MMIVRKDYIDHDHPECINVENMSTNDILELFPSEIRHMIIKLFLNCKIGNCFGDVQMTSVYNFQKDDTDKFYADSFTLRIPYAGQAVHWEIMFSHQDLLTVPDIMFDDDFLCEPQLLNTLKTNIKSLTNWNPYDSESLVTLIQEYFVLYKKYNINMLSNEERYSRCCFEYTSLVGETGVGADEVEVLVEPNGSVHFLINITVDFSSLPVFMSRNNGDVEDPGTDLATLLVTFQRFDGSKIQPFLHLSPQVEQVLGNSKCIPPFNSQECLMDYVPIIKKMLNDKIESIVTNHRMKNEYITYLLTMYSGSVVEYDTLTSSKITLLFENKNFYFLVIIQLGNKFPSERPRLMLRSVYNLVGNQNKPFTDQLNDYPYSPRWKPDEMVQRMLTYTFENITTFQNKSIQRV